MENNRQLANFRFYEKLKAGLGAAGFTAVLAEGLFSSNTAARIFGVSLPIIDRLGGFGTILLSLIAFFVASFLSDVTEAESKKEASMTNMEER